VTKAYREDHVHVSMIRRVTSRYRPANRRVNFSGRLPVEPMCCLYSGFAAGTVRAMLCPTPRTDRWDPWIALVLLIGLIAAAGTIHLLVR